MTRTGTFNTEASLGGKLTPLGNISPGKIDSTPKAESLEGGLTVYTPITDNIFKGPYEVIPKVDEEQELPTADKMLSDNILVKEIPFYKTSNEIGGYTIYIGGE